MIFLPSYSPIEETFSKVKTFLRRAGVRTREALHEAIGQAPLTVTTQDAHSGSIIVAIFPSSIACSSVSRRHRLAHLNEVAVGIPQIAAKLSSVVLWLRQKGGPSASPLLIAGPDVGDSDIQETGGLVRMARRMKRHLGFIVGGPPPVFTISQLVAS